MNTEANVNDVNQSSVDSQPLPDYPLPDAYHHSDLMLLIWNHLACQTKASAHDNMADKQVFQHSQYMKSGIYITLRGSSQV